MGLTDRLLVSLVSVFSSICLINNYVYPYVINIDPTEEYIIFLINNDSTFLPDKWSTRTTFTIYEWIDRNFNKSFMIVIVVQVEQISILLHIQEQLYMKQTIFIDLQFLNQSRYTSLFLQINRSLGQSI